MELAILPFLGIIFIAAAVIFLVGIREERREKQRKEEDDAFEICVRLWRDGKGFQERTMTEDELRLWLAAKDAERKGEICGGRLTIYRKGVVSGYCIDRKKKKRPVNSWEEVPECPH